MSLDPLMNRLQKDLQPQSKAKSRIRERIESRMTSSYTLSEARSQLKPSTAQRKRLWERVSEQVRYNSFDSIFEKIRSLLTPPTSVRFAIERKMSFQLQPLYAAVRPSYTGVKWAAAFACFLLVARIGPTLFLAPETVADSQVLLLPTRGQVSVSVEGLWQPITEEFALEPGTMLRTRNGEATIVFRDDGVLRLDAYTTIKIHDTTARLEPAPDLLPTVTLFTGRLWVQGLVPAPLRGLTVASTYGTVTVNEGSVSVAEDDTVEVFVFDRRARVHHGDSELALVAGERTEMWEGNTPLSKKIAASLYDESWPAQNIARDAVHRRAVAQLQHERRIAAAGILPTSRLYQAKRIAEAVDVFFAFGEEVKVQKKLTHARTRLREATALLAMGNQEEDVSLTLDEYRDSLVTLATGTGGGSLVNFLLQQSLSEISAEIAAVHPSDDDYLIKRAVLEATAGLPDQIVDVSDVQGVFLVDTIALLNESVETGETTEVTETWIDLKPHLALLDADASNLDEEVRKEALALLSDFAVTLRGADDVNTQVLKEVSQYVPTEQKVVSAGITYLTEGQIAEIVAGIRQRIFVYHMQRSRINQLLYEFKAIEGHPEQGRILRALAKELPGGPENFPERVQQELRRLQWQRAAELQV